jgi:hypothetical protein
MCRHRLDLVGFAHPCPHGIHVTSKRQHNTELDQELDQPSQEFLSFSWKVGLSLMNVACANVWHHDVMCMLSACKQGQRKQSFSAYAQSMH